MYIWREKVAGDVTADIVNTGLYPLDVVDGFKIRPGFFRMNGAYQTANGVSFTISSHNATSCTLLLFMEESGFRTATRLVTHIPYLCLISK